MNSDTTLINMRGPRGRAKVAQAEQEGRFVVIGRPSKWGNPYKIGPDGTRDEVIEKYRVWIMAQPDLLRRLDQLDGKVLGCWCVPDPCHGGVLLELLAQRHNVSA